MARQFEKVGNKYGAPMGRRDFGTLENAEGKIRLFRVRLDGGGYDDGGAYWGLKAGRWLYCATDGADYRQFMRAAGRSHAALLLNIEPGLLARPFSRAHVRFGRFCATLEHSGGSDGPGYRVTTFGQYLCTLASWDALAQFAQDRERGLP